MSDRGGCTPWANQLSTRTAPPQNHFSLLVVARAGLYQVVDDVEAVILLVVGVDLTVQLLTHMVLQCVFVSEGFLAVQAPQAVEGIKEKKTHLQRRSKNKQLKL